MMTPTVTQASATLNVGQCSSVMKSGTCPLCPPTIRSLRLPTAPAEHQSRAHRQGDRPDLGHDEGQHHDPDAEQHRHDERSAAEQTESEP